MSDFSLMDAIECGIVKLPRVPVADNIPGDEMPMFRNLWEHIRKKMPRRDAARPTARPAQAPAAAADRTRGSLRPLREDLRALAGSRDRAPPCFIVVCNNTSTSKLVYDYISGFHRENEDGTLRAPRTAGSTLFRNFDEHGNPLPAPRTLLIDSEQLESGDALRHQVPQDGSPTRSTASAARSSSAPATCGPPRTSTDSGPAARGHEHRRQDGQARRRRSAASCRSRC